MIFFTYITSDLANSLERLTYLHFTSVVCTDVKEMYLIYVIMEIEW